MPSDERYRAWSMAPRPYRVVDRYADRPGELTWVLAPEGPGICTPDGRPIGAGGAVPGQYWVLHTSTGERIPAADVTCRSLLTDGRAGDSTLVQATALCLPCGPRVAALGDRVGLAGPKGSGWDLYAANGRHALLIGWESGLALLRPLVERVLAEPARYERVSVWADGISWSAIAGSELLAAWSDRAVVTVSLPARGDLARTAAQQVAFDPATTVAFLAGPLETARAAAALLAARGLPPDRVQIAAHELLKCGSGRCGRCRLPGPDGPIRACRQGPVVRYEQLTAAEGTAL